ncbi:MAG TPA: hypothetical protein DCW83_01195 [Saprospirales bacterium]|jgi:hypothetical protein|nr:hypothetical protein [Saprospirales bacterium]
MTPKGLGMCDRQEFRMHGDLMYLKVTLKTGESVEYLNTEVRFLDMEVEVEEIKRRKRLDAITGKINEKF